MTVPRVPGALLSLLLVAPSCGGRTLLERHESDSAPTSGGASGSNSSGATNSGGITTASGGNSSGATSSGGVATASGGSSACRVETVLSPRPPVLEFLVDSSLSMKTTLTAELSRWSALQLVLAQTFQTLDANTLSGLTFYPNVQLSAGSHEGSTWCFLRLAAATVAPLAPEQRLRILDALAAKSPLGATPTHDVYLYALEQLRAASEPGRAHLVLITDSAPTYALGCSGTGITPVDTAPLEAAATDALAKGIHTFVIGLGNADSAPWMSRLAVAGGTASPICESSGPPFCHYQVGSADDPVAALADALFDVSSRATSCVYELPNEAAALQLDSGAAELRLSDAAIPGAPLVRYPPGADCDFGFVHSEPKSRSIELCPRLCQANAQQPGARIALSLPCQASP